MRLFSRLLPSRLRAERHKLPSRSREGLGVGKSPPSQRPTPLRLASKLASLAAPPAGGRGAVALAILCGLSLTAPATAQSRAIVEASAPQSTAITIYRDPNRSTGDRMNRNWPRGFAMISETRQVTLPQGRSTIRFEGVAEGMVAVSAIVTGLPGGTIEKNRNADLLSPAALVDGTLGNRIRITRTNPATGVETSESAIIRTRADGGLVVQTAEGYQAVRCAGVPERLSFDDVPDGLSAKPIFSIDTASEQGGTYTVTLSYLAWGFDWEANYVATLHEGREADDIRFDLVSWLTLLNDNAQSFPDAELMAVAGRLEVTSDYEELADLPVARPLRLTCYPIGSTAWGSPIPNYDVPLPVPSPPPPMMMRSAVMMEAAEDGAELITVTGRKRVEVQEENLGDLKLYRVPEPLTVAAQSLKQIAFLRREGVKGRLLYQAACSLGDDIDEPTPASMLIETVNDQDSGLGVALPNGQMAIFERGDRGELLVAEDDLRDYASGQDVEIELSDSTQVFSTCERLTVHDPWDEGAPWSKMRAEFTNANDRPVTLRLELGSPQDLQWRDIRSTLNDGQNITEIRVPANGTRAVEWRVKPATS